MPTESFECARVKEEEGNTCFHYSMEKFGELWKAVPKETMFEYRLMCRLASDSDTAAAVGNAQTRHTTANNVAAKDTDSKVKFNLNAFFKRNTSVAGCDWRRSS